MDTQALTMKLTVKDVAGLLQVPEKSIHRWLKSTDFPTHRVGDEYRFNRAEVLEWATAHRVPVLPELFCEPDRHGAPMPTLIEALEEGGIHHRIGGHDKPSALRAVVNVLRLPDHVDREYLCRVLLAREALGSTGVGRGIAVPHVRNPIVLHIPRASITLCFLERAIEFGAIDDQPVHALFTLVSPTVRTHLHMLSRLAYALLTPSFHEVIAGQGSRDAVLSAAGAVESKLGSGATPA